MAIDSGPMRDKIDDAVRDESDIEALAFYIEIHQHCQEMIDTLKEDIETYG
jgi:hypothetical protein